MEHAARLGRQEESDAKTRHLRVSHVLDCSFGNVHDGVESLDVEVSTFLTLASTWFQKLRDHDEGPWTGRTVQDQLCGRGPSDPIIETGIHPRPDGHRPFRQSVQSI
jgi:hypothetical protein